MWQISLWISNNEQVLSAYTVRCVQCGIPVAQLIAQMLLGCIHPRLADVPNCFGYV